MGAITINTEVLIGIASLIGGGFGFLINMIINMRKEKGKEIEVIEGEGTALCGVHTTKINNLEESVHRIEGLVTKLNDNLMNVLMNFKIEPKK